MSTKMLDKGYEPHAVERKWYAFWEKEGLFEAADSDARPAFSIVIPPPNVTGVLHMGHALNNTMQDILCRYRRLKGDNVLWMPGTDHAGIATQNVVERRLAEQGKDRHQVGREKFIEAVWEWRAASGSAIINQLKRLGASCDWQRERFTMDEGLSLSVRTVFVRLYEEGLIYRGLYIINWCPRCRTALSDLEVEHEELDGALYHIRYPFSRGEGGLVVVTTRPETLLGDTAVAIHSEDERYAQLPVATVTLPLMNREIPIIRDDYVDRSFGTGTLKVTPAHDPNDFEIGRRHGLPSIKVIQEDGTMSADAGRYQGLDRFECRKVVVQALRDQGLLERVDPHKHSVGHCYRCKNIVEPNLSMQWFVKTQPLAEPAIKAVQTGQTRIIPETWAKTYYEWMFNIKDWCISRQIWWGHQIPAWTCAGCEELIVAMEAPAKCPRCGGGDLVQETDVLDTWFSSALWPFSTMGWPDQTALLKTFYPTSVLVTGFDILFFWVARMMMMGIHFMGEVPFRDVYVHALVRDEEGKKMSKSKGNVIDPLNVIDQYGTDAFRYTLAAFAAQGRDVKMSEKRVEGYRHFINKLWNVARFALMHLEKGYARIDATPALSLPDRWILARLDLMTRQVTAALDEYRFNEAAGAAYQFVWHEFCDWYVEAIKPTLYDETRVEAREAARQVLWTVLRDVLLVLHPFAPFVTEEIWEKLPGTEGSIMRAAFPLAGAYSIAGDLEEAGRQMDQIMAIITAVRTIRGEMNISPAAKPTVTVQTEDALLRRLIEAQRQLVINLARLADIVVQETGEQSSTAATAAVANTILQVELKGVIDFEQEIQRLEKEIGKLNKDLSSINKKLNNDSFLSKAPAEVVTEVRDKHADLSEKQSNLTVTLERIRAFAGK